jgi:multiple sugar transport system permease protein
MVVVSMLWLFMYQKNGLINQVLLKFGIAGPDWLGDPKTALIAIILMSAWQAMGFHMVIWLSGLQTIPGDLYEAAELDGAGPMRVITGIKLPALRGAIVIATIFSIIGSFQLFNEPNILRTLAPNIITTFFTPNMYAYNLSFAGQQYNASATVAIVMGVITAVIAYVVQLRGARREDR